MKSIPGASQELVNEAGLYADRLSVNIEIPNEASLRTLAPEKDLKAYLPLCVISNKAYYKAPRNASVSGMPHDSLPPGKARR